MLGKIICWKEREEMRDIARNSEEDKLPLLLCPEAEARSLDFNTSFVLRQIFFLQLVSF